MLRHRRIKSTVIGASVVALVVPLTLIVSPTAAQAYNLIPCGKQFAKSGGTYDVAVYNTNARKKYWDAITSGGARWNSGGSVKFMNYTSGKPSGKTNYLTIREGAISVAGTYAETTIQCLSSHVVTLTWNSSNDEAVNFLGSEALLDVGMHEMGHALGLHHVLPASLPVTCSSFAFPSIMVQGEAKWVCWNPGPHSDDFNGERALYK